ncbi:DUF4238 domain-containing protein [Roseobacter sp. YSTF-M11]|uniref:DUF4238 domain-containing protein n=1 Tax=Roseobacter insulae TaxID=2859783 RepID=A0A9X1FZL2_9RHOB|nr:DUF4238 domain-containing protein [Roseobacter insulae]MBW4710297.1 DUF4238 domain-containing protein [Roseobacter insulae]
MKNGHAGGRGPTPWSKQLGQKRAKIHHFLPMALQKYFLNEAGQIWYSERQPNGVFSAPELRNTSSTFKERDYYTVFEDGKLSDRIEREFYAVIDDFLGKFLEEIHSTLDKKKMPLVSGDALGSIQKVAYHLLVRTPEFAKKYDDYEIGKELLEGTLADAKSAKLSAAEIATVEAELNDEGHVRKVGRTIRVKGQASPTKKVMQALKLLDLRFAESYGKHSFILPSMGAYRIGNGGPSGLSNPNMEIWIPISPKRALVLLQDPYKKIPIIAPEPRDHLRKVNLFGVANSTQIASHSERLLRSLIH